MGWSGWSVSPAHRKPASSRAIALFAAVERLPLQRCVEQRQLAVQAVQVDQHLLERGVREQIPEALPVDPLTMSLGPGVLALAVDAAVAQQLLENAVAGRHASAAQVIAAAQQ